jgi:YVTN family beta-propeller protein
MNAAHWLSLLLVACPAGPSGEDAVASATLTSSGPLYPDSWFTAEVTAVEGFDGELECRWLADGVLLTQGSCELDGLDHDIPTGAELVVQGVALRSGAEVDSLDSDPIVILDFPVGAVTELGGGSLAFLDTRSNTLSDRIDLILDPDALGLDATSSATEKAGYPMQVLYTPEHDKLLVTSSIYGTIWEIDPVAREVIDYARPSTQNYWLIFSEDAQKIWMTDMELGGISLLNRDYEIQRQVETGSWPITMLHDEDRGWIHICHHDDAWVVTLDDETLEEVNKIDHTLGPYWIEPHPDGESIWVVTEFDDAVARYSLPDFEQISYFEVDDLPNFIHFRDDEGTQAYVTSFHEGLLDLIDTSTGEILERVDAGTGAVAIIERPDGRFVYVPNTLAHSISVIDQRTNEVVDIVYHARGPRWIQWLDPVHAQ